MDIKKYRLALFGVAFGIVLSSFCFADEIDNLIPHIIQAESRGDPHAVSKAGAIGLMQITPIVMIEFEREYEDSRHRYDIGLERLISYNTEKYQMDLYNPIHNIKIGTWYLHRLKDHYLKENYTVPRLLAAYNGGITRLRKLNYNIDKMPRETREYVYKIIKSYNKSCPLDPIKYKDLGRYVK